MHILHFRKWPQRFAEFLSLLLLYVFHQCLLFFLCLTNPSQLISTRHKLFCEDNFPLATCDCPVGMTKFSENATYCCPALYSGDRCEDNSLFIISLVLAFLFSVSVMYIVYVDCSMPEDKNMILYLATNL